VQDALAKLGVGLGRRSAADRSEPSPRGGEGNIGA